MPGSLPSPSRFRNPAGWIRRTCSPHHGKSGWRSASAAASIWRRSPRSHRDIGFIGVEPFVNGVARLLSLAEAASLDNLRILSDDARLLLRALPDASIGRAFVLFPDPWPKLRHHKRRIVNPDTVRDLARVLQPGAELRLATDDADYARAMLETVLAEPRFAWLAERSADWLVRPEDWPPTRYEEKALAAGRRPAYLRFVRAG